MDRFEGDVHPSRLKDRIAFEVCVNRSEVLSLIEQIMAKSKDLMVLSNRLTDALSVAEDNQSR